MKSTYFLLFLFLFFSIVGCLGSDDDNDTININGIVYEKETTTTLSNITINIYKNSSDIKAYKSFLTKDDGKFEFEVEEGQYYIDAVDNSDSPSYVGLDKQKLEVIKNIKINLAKIPENGDTTGYTSDITADLKN